MSYTILLVDRTVPVRSGSSARSARRADGPDRARASRRAEIFQRVRPQLIVIHVALPDTTGLELCQVIKETNQGRATPVLLLAQEPRGQSHRAQALGRYGCDAYVEMPISDELLVERCRPCWPPPPCRRASGLA